MDIIQRKIKQTLGKIDLPTSNQRQHWQHYISQNKEFLYYKTDQIFQISYNNIYCNYHNPIMINKIPEYARPIDVHPSTHDVWQIKHRSQSYTRILEIIIIQFSEFVQTLPEWERLIFKNYNQYRQSLQEIITLVQEKKCYVVSNGSSAEKKGTYAWVLSTAELAKDKNTNPLIQCSGQVTNCNASSYQSEAFGMLLFLVYLYWSLQYYSIKNFPIIYYFADNEGLIRWIKKMIKKKHYKKFTPTFAISSEYDVIIAIFKV